MAAELTVTIDDGGMHRQITRAIDACAARGAVDRVSILVTGPEWLESCRIAESAELELSVHLNCIEPPFLGRGEFPSNWSGWILAARRLAADARREWALQIEQMLSAGFRPTRLDSHRHLHHLGVLREVILSLAEEYGIGSVRAAVLPDRFRRPSGIMLDSLARKLVRMARSRDIEATGSILGFSSSGHVDRNYIRSFLPALPGGECELVMHPSAEPVWSPGQPEELDLMLSEWFGKWIRGNG